MNIETIGFWDRALKTLQSAKIPLPTDPDGSASCSYYCAFYAVSALFALQDKFFSKHSASFNTTEKKYASQNSEDSSKVMCIFVVIVNSYVELTLFRGYINEKRATHSFHRQGQGQDHCRAWDGVQGFGPRIQGVRNTVH